MYSTMMGSCVVVVVVLLLLPLSLLLTQIQHSHLENKNHIKSQNFVGVDFRNPTRLVILICLYTMLFTSKQQK